MLLFDSITDSPEAAAFEVSDDAVDPDRPAARLRPTTSRLVERGNAMGDAEEDETIAAGAGDKVIDEVAAALLRAPIDME